MASETTASIQAIYPERSSTYDDDAPFHPRQEQEYSPLQRLQFRRCRLLHLNLDPLLLPGKIRPTRRRPFPILLFINRTPKDQTRCRLIHHFPRTLLVFIDIHQLNRDETITLSATEGEFEPVVVAAGVEVAGGLRASGQFV